MAGIHTILSVDDDEDDQLFLAQALELIDSTIKVITAANGKEALALLEKSGNNLPDYIFLDINMPLMDGKEFLAAVKEQEELKHLPVVVYSTAKEEEIKEEMLKNGAIAFLSKPSSFNDICSEINTMLSKLEQGIQVRIQK